MYIHDLADMGIYGKSIHMMQCKQTDTLCYLFSHATELHQFFFCLVVTHIIDFFQGDFTGGNGPGCRCDIFCPVSKAASSQVLFRYLAQCLHRWKRVIFHAHWRNFSLPVFPADGFDTFADPFDIILLGNQKRNDHFPEILS